MGAKYTFDGDKLTEKNRSTTIASVRGNKIFAKTSYTTTANIRGSKIEGPGEEVKAALWWYFVN